MHGSYDRVVETPAVQVVTTVPDEETAAAIADALLADRLAACVQVDGPVRSRYWWNGAIEESTELRCTIKTTAAAAERVVISVRELHPYDVPEILVVPVLGGDADYLEWLVRETS
jgi:periplasmic divalent cation tolerance protein